MRYTIWHTAIQNMRYGGQLCSLLKSTLVFMRDGEKPRGRRHPVVMHKQKWYQRLYFGLPIKVIATSTSCKMFPVPSVYCTGNLLTWFAQQKNTVRGAKSESKRFVGGRYPPLGALPPPPARLMPALPHSRQGCCRQCIPPCHSSLKPSDYF